MKYKNYSEFTICVKSRLHPTLVVEPNKVLEIEDKLLKDYSGDLHAFLTSGTLAIYAGEKTVEKATEEKIETEEVKPLEVEDTKTEEARIEEKSRNFSARAEETKKKRK